MHALLSRLSMRTAGESHGVAGTVVLDGVPRGLALDVGAIDATLRRRQGGAGRGGRQRIEDDAVEITAGVRRGRTLGSPLALVVRNRDATIDSLPEPSRPRPGHADLAGCYRYLDRDIRGTLERASARETAARVAAGAVAAQLLAALDGEVFGFVRGVGAAVLEGEAAIERDALTALRARRDGSRLYTLTEAADAAMLDAVRAAAAAGDTVGGICEAHAFGVLPGLGSCNQWHERLDARLAAAVMSIPAFKGFELGLGFEAGRRPGSSVQDPIEPAGEAVAMARPTNHAGGIEAGMTNGQPVVLRAAMKPIATLRQPLPSVDLASGAPAEAGYERSDVCAVSAASVVVEAMVALVLADATLARVGGESMAECRRRADEHRAACREIGR